MQDTFEPLRALAALRAGGVHSVLIGELAAMAHGSETDADRIELCVPDDDEQIGRLGNVLLVLEAEQDEAAADDPHRVAFRTSAGRIECIEMPNDDGFVPLHARARDMDLGGGVITRVAALEDVAQERLGASDLLGAARAVSMLANDTDVAVEDGPEFGPEPTDGDRALMRPLRRVWRAFEGVDRFLSDAMDGKGSSRERQG